MGEQRVVCNRHCNNVGFFVCLFFLSLAQQVCSLCIVLRDLFTLAYGKLICLIKGEIQHLEFY